ncbi:MAG: hypothetical protein ACJAYF_000494 [Arenicella sp.]|jgi:hypothetical protein
MKFNLTSTLAILAATITFSGAVTAQSNQRVSIDPYRDVTIYEHCNFGGKSQTLRAGEYRSMRDAGFANDSVSSIRVPQGAEVTIYADDNYRGSFARIDGDIRCFDRQWNDKVSALTISADGGQNGRYNDRANDGRRDTRNRNDGGRNDPNVTAANVTLVVFGGVSLKKVAAKQWIIDQTRGATKQFDETRRDRDSVYLENRYTSERVRIDLFANDVTVVDSDGRQQRYSIDRKNAAAARSTRPVPVANAPSSSGNGRIRGACFDFKAYTQGGNASLRFEGKGDLYRFNNRATSGRICHKGRLNMGLGKTASGTNVIVEINGDRYTFPAGDQGDQFLNNWYRKTIRLNVGN